MPSPGEIGAKDFARSQVGVRHDQRSRERTPEMANDAHLETPGQVCVPTERKLVRSVQHRGSKVAVGVGIVERTDPIVLVGCDRVGRPCADRPAAVLEPR